MPVLYFAFFDNKPFKRIVAGRPRSMLAWLCSVMLFSLALVPYTAAKEPAPTWSLFTREIPFDYQSKAIPINYTPLSKSSKRWLICTLYPHLKDPYWLGVNYGMVSEVKRLGVALKVFEAGGYPQIEKQREQLEQCIATGADVILLGTVSFNALTPTITKISQQQTLITGLVNDIANQGISAKTGVSWYDMGYHIGHYLVDHSKHTQTQVNIAWFPGPKGAGWVKFIDDGFRDSIADTAIHIATVKWGDTGKEIQRNLVQEVLDENPNLDYIVGTALTADAAVSELIHRGLEGKIKILSTYMTQNVLRGIKRGHILAAPNDSPILQGKIAVEQAIRLLEQDMTYAQLSPPIEMVDQPSLASFDFFTVLPPPSYWPTYEVNISKTD